VVSVYQLIVKDSIEEKIQKMQEAKKNLADEILGGEVGGLAKLGRKELLELFEG
jgi:SNF2 family DNA or RNA helicase